MPVETLIHQSQQAYYDAIPASTQAGSSTLFIEFMLETIRSALADTLAQQETRKQHEQINERFANVLGERQRRILSLILANPSCTYDSLAARIGVSSATVRRDMSKLEGMGIVRRMGARKKGQWIVDLLAQAPVSGE